MRRKTIPKKSRSLQVRRNQHVRKRTALPSDFDWKVYIESHADLQRAGIVTREQAEDHFLKVGHSENRIYSKDLLERQDLPKPPPMASSDWLTNDLSKKRGAIFTCVSGAYDTLKEPLEIDPLWDYICFTDTAIKSKTWQIRPIPGDLINLSAAKRARAIKIMPHKYLEEYDYTFWIDASILIKRAVTTFVAQTLRDPNSYFAIPKHPDRICVYEEAAAVKRMKKDAAAPVDQQIAKYKSTGYPTNWGLVQSGLIIRKKTDDVINFCEMWWAEVKEGSKRDQLSFNYVLWRYTIQIRVINPANFGGLYFHLYSHKGNKGKKEPFPIKFRKDYGRLENYINGKRV